MHYRLSPRQIARCRCNDSGVNVIEAGGYCMLRPRIWRDTFGLDARVPCAILQRTTRQRPEREYKRL